jgi:RNA polymerase sigma factor (sigma-70 family)
MILVDQELVEAARRGSRAALDGLVRALQQPVYNLALRMLANPTDAEDAAQEIIIKIITSLGGLREPGAAGAWALRVALRHLVHDRKMGRVEAMRFSFPTFGADLLDGLEAVPDDKAADPELNVLVAQVKVGCTLALLTCLSRPLRAAYILGEVYELSDLEAAAMLEIEHAAYRQRLRRARALVLAFTQHHCGIVSSEARCRCAGRVKKALASGRAQRETCVPEMAAHDLVEVRNAIARLDRDRRTAALLRSNPDFGWEAKHLDLLDRDAST